MGAPAAALTAETPLMDFEHDGVTAKRALDGLEVADVSDEAFGFPDQHGAGRSRR